jgi:hypothetical protein
LNVITRNLSLRLFACAALLFTLNGCVNLDDAAGLSKLADNARRALPKVSNDIGGTCARQDTLFENTPSNERPSSSKPLDCKPYHELARDVANDQNILLDYFDALGKLASDQTVYGKAIATNTRTISTSSNLSANAATASTNAQTLLKAIADAATRGYREKQLGQLVKDNDSAVQSLTRALEKIIAGDYGTMLSNEESTLDSFYQAPIAAAQSNPPPSERLTLILVQRQYALDKTAIQYRKEAAANYGKLMDGLADLHSKLAEEATQKVNSAQIAKEIAPIVDLLKNNLANLQ